MINILSAILAAAGLKLLSLTGPNEPMWLPYAVTALLVTAIIVVGYGFNASINEQTINPADDEHRDNSI